MKFRRALVTSFVAALTFASALDTYAASCGNPIECLGSGAGSSGAGFTFTTLASFRVPSGSGVGTLIQATDGNLYGTLFQGGATGAGTVFRITTAGVFTTLHDFNTSDGRLPDATLLQAADGALYGTTLSGGANGAGAIFKITTAGAFTLLHSMTAATEGSDLRSALIQAPDGLLYGTAHTGGAHDVGTVFKLATDGSGFTVLHTFDDTSTTDGANPRAGLFRATDGNLYGTTEEGGASALGTIFRISTSGTFSQMYSFAGTDGSDPRATVAQASDGNLWGTTYTGGTNSLGTIFKISTSGVFSSVLSFTGTNGSLPRATPVQASDGKLYGTTTTGGANGIGSVYSVTTTGTLATVFSFTTSTGDGAIASVLQASDGNLYTITDQGGPGNGGAVVKVTLAGAGTTLKTFGDDAPGGTNPIGALVDGGDGFYYGTAYGGGNSNRGVVFRMTPAGVVTVLHHFAGSDGNGPSAGLVKASDGNYYGVTELGGASNAGTVFKITPTGTFTSLHAFNGTDGSAPDSALIQASDGNLWGTTSGGGTVGDFGTIFSIDLAGTTFTSRKSFSDTDGSFPFGAALVSFAGALYGTTETGGANGQGTAFKITTGGTFTSLSSFARLTSGAFPAAALTVGSDGNLWGTTYRGPSASGVVSAGTVFKMTSAGAVTLVHTFTTTDGSQPIASVVAASDGTFWGTTTAGGSGGSGVLFNVHQDGSGFTLAHQFGGNDGQEPREGLLIDSSGAVIGTTQFGGATEGGVVYKVTRSASSGGGGGGGALPAATLGLLALAAALRRRKR